jgi:hypothetical protein
MDCKEREGRRLNISSSSYNKTKRDTGIKYTITEPNSGNSDKEKYSEVSKTYLVIFIICSTTFRIQSYLY